MGTYPGRWQRREQHGRDRLVCLPVPTGGPRDLAVDDRDHALVADFDAYRPTLGRGTAEVRNGSQRIQTARDLARPRQAVPTGQSLPDALPRRATVRRDQQTGNRLPSTGKKRLCLERLRQRTRTSRCLLTPCTFGSGRLRGEVPSVYPYTSLASRITVIRSESRSQESRAGSQSRVVQRTGATCCLPWRTQVVTISAGGLVPSYGLVTEPATPVAETAWQQQSVWSQTADRLKAGPTRLRTLRLWLTVGAAALALAGSQVKPTSDAAALALALVAAVTLAGAGALRGLASADQVRDWTRARSVSEALKTEVYLYLCSGGDYQSGDREQRLESALNRVESSAGDLARYTNGIRPVKRDLPKVHDIDSYLEVRVRRGQLEGYYERKALGLRARLRQLKVAEIALALVAAGLAAAAAANSTVGAWAAVATTGAGAVAAYIAAERYEYLWIEYSRTARELRRLLNRRTSVDARPLPGPDLAAACEQVISVQNEAWMAKWGEDDGSAPEGLA